METHIRIQTEEIDVETMYKFYLLLKMCIVGKE